MQARIYTLKTNKQRNEKLTPEESEQAVSSFSKFLRPYVIFLVVMFILAMTMGAHACGDKPDTLIDQIKERTL